MKITYFHKTEAKVLAETLDDLWTLSSIIDVGDILEGKTFRKIKMGGGDDRSQAAIKKPVYLVIEAEKIEFHQYSDVLRVSGKTLEANEDIPKGSYHTFSIEPGTHVKITKTEWLNYQRKKIEEATKEKPSDTLICVFDREEAYIALLKKYGFDILVTLKGDVQKKDQPEAAGKNFYEEIIDQLKEYKERHAIKHIILASPAFWKEELYKCLKDPELKKIIVQATCSSCDENAINEVIKRPEVQTVLQQERASGEINLVERLLSEISKNGAAAYGIKETQSVADAGAIQILLVTDNIIQKTRQDGTFRSIERIMKTADKTQAEVHIISSEHDGGKKLDGLGGVGAILRYKLSY